MRVYICCIVIRLLLSRDLLHQLVGEQLTRACGLVSYHYQLIWEIIASMTASARFRRAAGPAHNDNATLVR